MTSRTRTKRRVARSPLLFQLGSGGLSSLLVALATAVLALGIPVWRCWKRVLAAAGAAPLRQADAILVLGRRLHQGECTEVFRKRLDHAASLWLMGIAPRLILAGGITGDASRSEAEVGAEWLQDQGVPEEALLLEDRSRHTLENLFNTRELLRENGWSRLVLVSDPLHMARALAFAEGFSLDVTASPACDCPPRKGSFAWWFRSLREAFLLHWYRMGVAYSRWIRSERQLSRVT